MNVRTRFEYRLDLSGCNVEARDDPIHTVALGVPSASHTSALADLMIDAYRGTIDYDGETIEQALAEVRSYFDGGAGAPLLDCSRVCVADGKLVAACLVSLWEEKPLIAYVMTRAAWKGRGLGAFLLCESLSCLVQNGDAEVRAVITEGNAPSEAMFRRSGFVRLDREVGS